MKFKWLLLFACLLGFNANILAGIIDYNVPRQEVAKLPVLFYIGDNNDQEKGIFTFFAYVRDTGCLAGIDNARLNISASSGNSLYTGYFQLFNDNERKVIVLGNFTIKRGLLPNAVITFIARRGNGVFYYHVKLQDIYDTFKGGPNDYYLHSRCNGKDARFSQFMAKPFTELTK